MSQQPSPMRIRMLATTILVGLTGFLLDIPVDIMEEPFRISLIFGSVLPMALAMAWGWQVGLTAAVLGLGAMFPLALWPNNGWANLPTSLMMCLWFALHGWAATRRRQESAHWWHNPYFVEVLFNLVYALYTFTVFRWCFRFNPTPWSTVGETSMPFHTAWIIACKTPVNGLLVVLLADAALHMVPIRRWLRLPIRDEERYDSVIVTLGMMGGLTLWVIDALVDNLTSKDGLSWDVILIPDSHLLLSRLLLVAVSLAGALVVASFVRRRLRAASELQESMIRHQQTLETTMDGFLLISREGRFLEINQVYERMSGYSAAELMSMRIADLEANESPEEILVHRNRIQECGQDRFETRHRRKDGSVYEVEVSTVYRKDHGGHFFVFIRDISERKEALESLQLERTLYKDLVAAMPAGVYRCRVIHDVALKDEAWVQRVEMSLVSDAFCQILGVTRADCEADSMIVVNRIHPDDQAEFARLNIIGQQTLAPFNWEGRILRDGEVRWIHFASLPRKLANGDVIWTGVLFDTTIQKQAEVERQRLAEQLLQREKMDAVGQLAGGIAHDFNNQLAGVLGFAELLEMRLQEPRLKTYATHIHGAARRAADLTQQLLTFARKGKYRSAPTEINSVISEVAEMLRRSIDKRISITLRLEAVPSTVMGDSTQLQNLLLNLGLNARDAMPDGGELTIATRLGEPSDSASSQDTSSGRQLLISVQDTGIGMNADTQRRLFEPFFTTKPVGKGTGLGLASAYGAVKSHGGTIQVWSEPGRGSRFTISLPLLEEPQTMVISAESGERQPGNGCILVVDDEPIVLTFIDDLLADVGYRTRTCGDPLEAIELYRQHGRDIDLVIMDMVMPGMGGKDLFLAMRQINPQVKAIISSGYSLDGEAQSILDEGAKAFIQKPFDCATLELLIATTLKV